VKEDGTYTSPSDGQPAVHAMQAAQDPQQLGVYQAMFAASFRHAWPCEPVSVLHLRCVHACAHDLWPFVDACSPFRLVFTTILQCIQYCCSNGYQMCAQQKFVPATSGCELCFGALTRLATENSRWVEKWSFFPCVLLPLSQHFP
jgi:hypothetical protein